MSICSSVSVTDMKTMSDSSRELYRLMNVGTKY